MTSPLSFILSKGYKHLVSTSLLTNIPNIATTNNNNTNIPLITFDGTPSTTHEWASLNDPVMGGESKSTITITPTAGIFDGEVVDVPFLEAPGFVQAYTVFRDFRHPFLSHATPFPDVTGCQALEITAALPTGTYYDGFKISFGTSKNKKYNCGRHSFGHKAPLVMETVTSVQKVVIPFTDFTDCNDDATGLPIVTCEDDEDVCPDEEVLKDMKTLAIWGEGVKGEFHMEIYGIEATQCSSGGNLSKESLSAEEMTTSPLSSSMDIILATFDGEDEATTRIWEQKNDPVMGGESTGTFTIEDGIGHFQGEVVDVPFLSAPGFIKAQTVDMNKPYPDISNCHAIKLLVQANGEPYDGYRFSFHNNHPPDGFIYAYGYKADFALPVMEEFVEVVIPFKNFTDYWDDATGDAIVSCQEDEKYCADESVLKNVKTLSVWAEGVKGKVDLEIKSVSATSCGEGSIEAEQERHYLRV